MITIRVKPGEKMGIDNKSYTAIKPHAILEINLQKETFLVEYPENEVLKKDWVSLKDLEKRGVIKLAEEAEVEG